MVAVLWVSIVALVDALYGGKFGLIGFLAIGPFIAAAFAGARRTALVGLYATFFSLILSTPPRQYDQLNHLLPGDDPGGQFGRGHLDLPPADAAQPAAALGPDRDPDRAPAAGGGRDRRRACRRWRGR